MERRRLDVHHTIIDDTTQLPDDLVREAIDCDGGSRRIDTGFLPVGEKNGRPTGRAENGCSRATRPRTLAKVAAGLLVWATCLFGVLQFGPSVGQGLHMHGLCGPWGCAPPVSALITWHGFWLVLVAPLMVLIALSWSPEVLRRVGLVLALFGILGVAGIGVREAVNSLRSLGEGEPTYFVRRFLFSIVTLVDVPLITITLAGFVAWGAARMKKPPRSPSNRVSSVAENSMVLAKVEPSRLDQGKDVQ